MPLGYYDSGGVRGSPEPEFPPSRMPSRMRKWMRSPVAGMRSGRGVLLTGAGRSRRRVLYNGRRAQSETE